MTSAAEAAEKMRLAVSLMAEQQSVAVHGADMATASSQR